MTNADLKKFLVLYLVPQAVIADWQKTDPEIRNPPKRKCAPIGVPGWRRTEA
jgi:hypothetical protein